MVAQIVLAALLAGVVVAIAVKKIVAKELNEKSSVTHINLLGNGEN